VERNSASASHIAPEPIPRYIKGSFISGDMQVFSSSNNDIQNIHLYHWRNGYCSSTVFGINAKLFLGYIGGSVLQRLLDHPKRESFEITALVRSADKAKLLNTLGVKTVVASLSDLDRLTELAAASDVVIHTVFFVVFCVPCPSSC
jgi:hypothetical protein